MGYLDLVDVPALKLAPESVLNGWDGYVSFDAYTATMTDLTKDQLIEAVAYSGCDKVEHGLTGHHMFEFRDVISDRHGNSVASVYYGGKTHGSRVMLDVKGYRTTDAVRDLRSASAGHRCTRMDSRIDFDRPGAFDELLEPLVRIKARRNLRGEKRGDWDHPEDGRTQYVGSPQSAVRVRLYEKGKEPGFRQMCRWDWVRLEVQVRPKKEARDVYAGASPLQAWGASEWTRELAGELLQRSIAPLRAEPAKVPSVLDRKLYWMCKQYGGSLIELFQHYEGELEAVGAHISDVLGIVANEQSYGQSHKARAKAGHG